MNRKQAVSAALQLQHDAGLMMSNLQVFVTSLNRMSSEVLRLAFGQDLAGGSLHGCDGIVAPTWLTGCTGPLPTSSCNDCLLCNNCFPDLRK